MKVIPRYHINFILNNPQKSIVLSVFFIFVFYSTSVNIVIQNKCCSVAHYQRYWGRPRYCEGLDGSKPMFSPNPGKMELILISDKSGSIPVFTFILNGVILLLNKLAYNMRSSWTYYSSYHSYWKPWLGESVDASIVSLHEAKVSDDSNSSPHPFRYRLLNPFNIVSWKQLESC